MELKTQHHAFMHFSEEIFTEAIRNCWRFPVIHKTLKNFSAAFFSMRMAPCFSILVIWMMFYHFFTLCHFLYFQPTCSGNLFPPENFLTSKVSLSFLHSTLDFFFKIPPVKSHPCLKESLQKLGRFYYCKKKLSESFIRIHKTVW